jgi:xanthine dehydrogenase YagT iron-sulfur-binding subunit
MDSTLTLRVDGIHHELTVDTRTSLLDALRRELGVTSPKKGCDHGQCGACTVLVGDRRVLPCLDRPDGDHPDGEHPLLRAFVDADALQCGFCTPGQVCSAVAVLDELGRGWPSAVTSDLASDPVADDAEIAERMSGNLCRCGAYPGFRAAVRRAADEMAAR